MLPTLIGIILLMVVLLVAIGWAVIYGLQFLGIRMPWQSAPPPVEVVEAPVPPVETQPAQPATPTQPETPAAPAETPPPVETVAAVEPAAATPPEKPVAATPTAPPAAVTPEPTVAPPAAAAPRPKVIWPALKLKGIVGGGSAGAVMLNDKVLGIDETIEGVRVASIDNNGAWLEYQGERRFLKVGKALE